MRYTYEFPIDAAETVRAIRYLRRRSGLAWVEWAVWPVLLGLAALYLASGWSLRELWLLGVVAAFLLALRWLTPFLQVRQLRRAYAETPSLQGLQVYEFADAGLTITAGASTVTLGWDSFVEATETDEFFLFFYSKKCAYYLPKRVMRDSGEKSGLRAHLRAKLGSRAAGLRVDESRLSPA